MPTHTSQKLARALIGLALVALAALQGLMILKYVRAANTDQPLGALHPDRHPVTPPRARPADRPDRVVLVVLDGLRDDTARQMPALADLGLRWPFLSAQAPIPSLSRPSYASMASGAEPWRTGIRTNGFASPVRVDTFMRRARDAGLKVRGAGNLDFWGQNYADDFNPWRTTHAWDQPQEVDALIHQMLALPSDLLVIHLIEMDRVGHDHGGASPQYAQVAQALDARLKKLFKEIDLQRQTLIITADHGHMDDGGHGGGEPVVRLVPLLMAGKGIKPGPASGDVGDLGQIAPTIALLLGIELPRDLSLPPVEAALDPTLFDAAHLDARRAEWRDHRAAYERRWLEDVHAAWTSVRWSGEVVGNDVSAATVVDQSASLETLIEARERTLGEIHRDHRVARTPLVALIVVPLLVLLVIGGLRGFKMAPIAVAPVAGLTTAALYLGALGRPFSFSAIASYGQIAVEIGLCFALGLAASFALQASLLRKVDPEIKTPARLFHATYAALLHAAVAPLFWLLWGFAIDAPLPGPALMFLPLFAGYTGGLFCAAAGLACILTAPFMPPSTAASTPSTPSSMVHDGATGH